MKAQLCQDQNVSLCSDSLKEVIISEKNTHYPFTPITMSDQ